MPQLSENFNRRFATIAAAKPSLALRSAYRLHDSNTAFRINASHGPYPKALLRQDYIDMTAAALDNTFTLVADTLEVLGNTQNQVLITGIVEANVAVKPYVEEEVRAGYKSLAANVFIDDEDSIWKVVESNGTKQLVQSVKEDFAQLIASRIARQQMIASAYPGMVPSSGDYVAYYNTYNQGISWGYALVADDITVFDRHSQTEITILPANVVEIVAGDCLDNQYNVTKFLKEQGKIMADDMSGSGFKAILDFYRNIYKNTAYLEKLEKIISARRKLGDNLAPMIDAET